LAAVNPSIEQIQNWYVYVSDSTEIKG